MRYEVNAVIHGHVVSLLRCMSTNAKKIVIAELLLLRGSKAARSHMDISEGRCLGRPQGAIGVSLFEGVAACGGGGSLAFACKKGQREMAIEPDYPHEAQRSGELQKLPA